MSTAKPNLHDRVSDLEAIVARLSAANPLLGLEPGRIPDDLADPMFLACGAPLSWSPRGTIVSDARLVIVAGRDALPHERHGEKWLNWRSNQGVTTVAWSDPRMPLDLGPIPGTGLRILAEAQPPNGIHGWERGQVMPIATLVHLARRRAARVALAGAQ